jgi:predicted nucleotidyltransferase
MKTREQVIAILQTHKHSLSQRWPISSLYLFGSVARGDQREGSDVDLLIELKGAMGWDFFNLAGELEALIGEKVDLIPRQGIKPRYWDRIAPDVVEVFHV